MKKLVQNNAFNIGLWSGFIIFTALNYLSYISAVHEFSTNPNTFSAGGYEFGFPFKMYGVYFGYLNSEELFWTGVIANILIVLVCSFLIGLSFKFLWSKTYNSTSI